MNATRIIAPPPGYESWLDFAVGTMDVRSAQLLAIGLTDDDSEAAGQVPSYDEMRHAARAELATLRNTQTQSTGKR